MGETRPMVENILAFASLYWHVLWILLLLLLIVVTRAMRQGAVANGIRAAAMGAELAERFLWTQPQLWVGLESSRAEEPGHGAFGGERPDIFCTPFGRTSTSEVLSASHP